MTFTERSLGKGFIWEPGSYVECVFGLAMLTIFGAGALAMLVGPILLFLRK